VDVSVALGSVKPADNARNVLGHAGLLRTEKGRKDVEALYHAAADGATVWHARPENGVGGLTSSAPPRYTRPQSKRGWRRPHARMQRPATGKPVTACCGSPALSRNCKDELAAV
jgi:hypothetical protein